MSPMQFIMKMFSLMLSFASIPGIIFFFEFMDKYVRPYTDPFVNKYIHPLLNDIIRSIFGIY